ncbi:MAG: serine/threonine protein kinase [Deltaproteobacteria bacterium]|nr:serine/threonine protein kinase [Deltaproteobacteria bacterium]
MEAPSRQGEVLAGRYLLREKLGAGGMGEVYQGRDQHSGRDVAVKVLHRDLLRQPEVVERFLREARAANTVRHPNVVEVYDVGTDDRGAPFMVQELLRGMDLCNYLGRRGPLPVDEALTLMLPVIDAVGYAHTRGVVHRDLKPENVFLAQRDGLVVPKVLDFGLSRIVGADAARRLTATGIMMGTPVFMSPEQVQGKRDVDARSDVWTLGVMLYECLTGRLPFDGETDGALYVQICTGEPMPLQRLARGVPPPVAAVVARCLCKAPDARFPHAGAMAEALRQTAAGYQLRTDTLLTLELQPRGTAQLAPPTAITVMNQPARYEPTQALQTFPVSPSIPEVSPMELQLSASLGQQPSPLFVPATMAMAPVSTAPPPAPRPGVGAFAWVIFGVGLFGFLLVLGVGVLLLSGEDDPPARRPPATPAVNPVGQPVHAIPLQPTASQGQPPPPLPAPWVSDAGAQRRPAGRQGAPSNTARPANPNRGSGLEPAQEDPNAPTPRTQAANSNGPANAPNTNSPTEPGTVTSGTLANPARAQTQGGHNSVVPSGVTQGPNVLPQLPGLRP